MNGFKWNRIPDPNPLIERGKYKVLSKPAWKVKPLEVHSMPYDFKMNFSSVEPLSTGNLVFQSVQPSSLREMQQYISYVLKQSPLPDFINEETNIKPIKFNSYFETGNLHKAFELYSDEYDLFMSADTNTKGQTRWFHFSVQNCKKGQTVRFNICNFHKPIGLFRQGMRPVYYSQHEVSGSFPTWQPVQGDIEFFRNSSAIDASKKLYYYTLSFSHKFLHAQDTVFFALTIPYAYTRLFDFLSELEGKVDGNTKISFKREELCKSVGGLTIPKLIITAPKSLGAELYKRKAIVITARVHPAETAGSWVMEGMLEFLLSSSAAELRNSYIFYVIPMLNPDGVVYGNSRCGLMGIDLNRRWETPSGLAHPSIYACKEMMRAVAVRREILMFCDLHGHSKKMNAFIYGCNTAANGGFTSWTKVRLLPRVVARRCSLFSYSDCRFMVKPDKQGTGRVVAWREFSITNSFTLETSMYGYRIGDVVKEFTRQDLGNIGVEVMRSILEYNFLLKSIEFELKISGGWLKPIRLKQLTGVLAQDRLEKQYEETKRQNRNFMLRNKVQVDSVGGDWRQYFSEEELKKAYKRIQMGEEEIEEVSSGSESDPSEDNINEVEIVEFVRNDRNLKTAQLTAVIKNDETLSYSSNSVLLPERKSEKPKQKTRRSEQALYPHTSRTALSKLDDSVRPQSSSKIFSYRDNRSGRNTPGLSPIIFNTFRKNLGFYQQMFTTKSKIAHGSLEIMCTKLITAKNPKYNK